MTLVKSYPEVVTDFLDLIEKNDALNSEHPGWWKQRINMELLEFAKTPTVYKAAKAAESMRISYPAEMAGICNQLMVCICAKAMSEEFQPYKEIRKNKETAKKGEVFVWVDEPYIVEQCYGDTAQTMSLSRLESTEFKFGFEGEPHYIVGYDKVTTKNPQAPIFEGDLRENDVDAIRELIVGSKLMSTYLQKVDLKETMKARP